ncbi:ExeA family protein [Janthinobacterium fluminis]|uniref:AAA family ATPase n=1 Tax=Janthinobacterium fluminis TaxID=2987524 RepID=A0ABT5JY73_9BURK|nr:ExeA family protein [Janthinobacterium fluminis]MDC8757431.1 AAA family ATPase [Janthinobacterium fluminis]
MYTQFFQLKQAAFSIAPDPRYLFMSERHREALAHLLYGVGGGGGFVLLTGEIGAGKTTVCRCFMEQIPPHCKLAYIFNPKLSVEELLLSVCDEFGIVLAPRGAGPASVKVYVDAINAYLLASHGRGDNNVLIIDEAQNLSAEVLEQLRLLTNLETSERKLLQIILIGQPELRAMLARPELEQLAQRVIARYHLGSLSAGECAGYIAHRLAVAVAGATGPAPFPPRLMGLIHQLSQGVPRRINLLCDRALLGAYVENRREVSRAILRTAAAEVFGAARQRAGGGWRWPSVLAGVMAGALLSGAAAWQWLPRTVAPPASAARPAPLAPPAVAAVAPAPAATPAPADNGAALRALAALWGQALPEGQPCQVAAKLNLRCHQSHGGLDELRLLDRPAVLSLRDGAGAPTYAVLTALGDAGATLRVGGVDSQLSLDALAARFDGSFVTFWRAPRSWRDEVTAGDRGPDVDWLARRLAQMHGLARPADNEALDANLQRLLREFQQGQKLKADGVAGPKTFIRLIQLDGAKEPRLLSQTQGADAVAGK